MRLNHLALSVTCYVSMAGAAQSGRQERTFALPAQAAVEAASLSRAGNLVAAICSDQVVRVWSTRSGELLRSLSESGQSPRAVEFSTDARLLAIAYQIAAYEKGAIRVFDVVSWKPLYEFAAPVSPFITFALAFSPDNRRLAFSDINDQIWELGSGSLTDISPPFGGSSSLSFSTDGRWIASADGDAHVRVYDATSGTLQSTAQGFVLEPMAVAFAPGGKSLLAGGIDQTISVIDRKTGKVLRTLPKQPGLILSLDVSDNGSQVAVLYGSGEHFVDVNHLMLWNLDKGTIVADFQQPGITISGGAFVGDHYVVAAASRNELTLWSLP
jgi:WD40 repeat protein